VLDKNQKLNNIVESEQPKNNGRIPESNRSIRSFYKFRAGLSCLKLLPAFIVAGFTLSGCYGPTIATLGPINITQSDLVTTPIKIIIKQNKEQNNGK
jgi:hypothetical protein